MAVETGRWPLDLLDVPVWELLYVFHHLSERDARRAVEARAARLDAALLGSIGFNEPAKLEDERRAVVEALDALEYEQTTPTASLDERAAALLARIEAGRVLDPAALLPLPAPVS